MKEDAVPKTDLHGARPADEEKKSPFFFVSAGQTQIETFNFSHRLSVHGLTSRLSRSPRRGLSE